MEKLFALVCIAAGLIGFFWLRSQTQLAIDAGNWPTTTGQIIESRLDSRPAPGAKNSDRLDYRAVVRYRYTAGGVEHQSEQIRFPNPGYGQQSAAQQLLAAYPQGAAVVVYYHAENPGQACLQTGGHWSDWAGKAFALIFAALGMVLLLK